MRNQHDTHFALRLNRFEQSHNFFLHFGIKRRSRLICDKKFWITSDGDGNQNPLLLSTTQLVWVSFGNGLGIGELYFLQKRQHICLLVFFGEGTVQGNNFQNLLPTAHTWIECAHWVLKNHPDFFPAKCTKAIFLKRNQRLTIKVHASCFQTSVLTWQQTHQRHGCNRFSTSRLAYDS